MSAPSSPAIPGLTTRRLQQKQLLTSPSKPCKPSKPPVTPTRKQPARAVNSPATPQHLSDLLLSPTSDLGSPLGSPIPEESEWPSLEPAGKSKPRSAPSSQERTKRSRPNLGTLPETDPPAPPNLTPDPSTLTDAANLPSPTPAPADNPTTLDYASHPAYMQDEMYRIEVTCEPGFDRPDQWTYPYVTIAAIVAEAETCGQVNKYGLPNQDAVNQFAFMENRPPYVHATLVMPLSHAAAMHAIMKGEVRTVINDPKVKLSLEDAGIRDWTLRNEAKERQRQAERRQQEAQWLYQHTREITIKHNGYPGVPPLTKNRVEAMLRQHFGHVRAITYKKQHVKGVTVQGVTSLSMLAWVGEPMTPYPPAMLQDEQIPFAKYEYIYSVPVKGACIRCHQQWTACVRQGKWQTCTTHLYFRRQKERLEKETAQPPRGEGSRQTRMSRTTISKADLLNDGPALQRARQRN